MCVLFSFSLSLALFTFPFSSLRRRPLPSHMYTPQIVCSCATIESRVYVGEIEEQLPAQSRNLKRIGPQREIKRERERERERESWEGEKEEKDEAKGNVVADLEDLIINAYRQDWPIFAGSKGLRPSILISIIVRSSRNATSVDGTLYLMRRYQPTSLSSPDNPPVIPSFSFALSLSLLILL